MQRETIRSVAVRICVDVDDLERGVAFFTEGIGLHVGRRFDRRWAEMLGGSAVIDLLECPAGSVAAHEARRHYDRHWTPVHLDFTVDDLEAAIERAVSAGAILERAVRTEPYGLLANLADPFGHGFCLLQMNDRGYDALLEEP